MKFVSVVALVFLALLMAARDEHPVTDDDLVHAWASARTGEALAPDAPQARTPAREPD